jgi:hypothetical protein
LLELVGQEIDPAVSRLNSSGTNDWKETDEARTITTWIDTLEPEGTKAMTTLIIVLLVLFLLGGGGYWYRGRRA